MPRGRPRKAQFEDLDQDFKDLVANLKEDELRTKLAEIAINEHENREAKKADQDLDNKRMEYQAAGEIYRESTKMNKLRTAYCYSILDAMGKV